MTRTTRTAARLGLGTAALVAAVGLTGAPALAAPGNEEGITSRMYQYRTEVAFDMRTCTGVSVPVTGWAQYGMRNDEVNGAYVDRDTYLLTASGTDADGNTWLLRSAGTNGSFLDGGTGVFSVVGQSRQVVKGSGVAMIDQYVVQVSPQDGSVFHVETICRD